MNNMNNISRKFRWHLLATVSASALLIASYGAEEALAAGDDGDRPLVWIELGGQLDQLHDAQEKFVPSFMSSVTIPNQLRALDIQRPLAYAIDTDGLISFQPENSDWVFSAGIRYGRSHAERARHQQTKNAKIPFDWNLCSFGLCSIGKYGSFYPSSHVKFADGRSTLSERHLILDFEAGKDVGLGRWGEQGSSRISAGLRIAQFRSRSQIALHAEPDVNYPSTPLTNFQQYHAFKYDTVHFHDFAGSESAKRSFDGLGPKLSWKAMSVVAGNADSGEISVDWGIDVAVLFGRQKAQGSHQTTSKSYFGSRWEGRNMNGGPYDKVGFFVRSGAPVLISQHTNAPPAFRREKSVVVPNLGGFAGLSYRYSNAAMSLGYRADFFFNAIDGGIDARKNENRAFYGPYASISIGLGD